MSSTNGFLVTWKPPGSLTNALKSHKALDINTAVLPFWIGPRVGRTKPFARIHASWPHKNAIEMKRSMPLLPMLS